MKRILKPSDLPVNRFTGMSWEQVANRIVNGEYFDIVVDHTKVLEDSWDETMTDRYIIRLDGLGEEQFVMLDVRYDSWKDTDYGVYFASALLVTRKSKVVYYYE